MLWSDKVIKLDSAVIDSVDINKLAESIVRLELELLGGMGNTALRARSSEFKKLFSIKLRRVLLSVLAGSPLTVIKNEKSKGYTYRIDPVCPHPVSEQWKSALIEAGFEPNWSE